MRTSITLIGLILCGWTTLVAQTEADLKAFFEGKMVQVKLDMPATSKGIDIYPGKASAIDFDDYSQRIKEFGIALYNGDVVMITKVKPKKKHIEFQLAGGGYGTWGDETAYVSAPRVEKSNREKEIEELLKNESNTKTKSELEKELDELKRKRNREQERLDFEAEQTRSAKMDRIRKKALQSGSRFNIRFDQKLVSGDLTPESVMNYLQDYISFQPGDDAMTQDTNPEMKEIELRKGLLWETVAQMYGVPSDIQQEEGCGLKIMNCSYKRSGQLIEIKFVEGVVVSYQIKSN